jgi:hypothetical protein
MNYFILIVSMLIGLNKLAIAQCMCSAANSTINFNENSLDTTNAKASCLNVNVSNINRWFKPMETSATHAHHEHSLGTSMEHIVYATTQVVGVTYRFKKRNELVVAIPHTYIKTNVSTYKGFSDVQLMYNRLIPLKTLGIKLGAGVEVPTQLNNVASNNTQVIISSGSVNALASATIYYCKNKWTFKCNALAKYTTRNSNNADYGNYNYQSVLVNYTINKRAACQPKTICNALAGIHNELYGVQHTAGIVANNTGGNVLNASIGAMLLHTFGTITIQASQPIQQHWNGTQQSVGTTLKTTLLINF